MAAPLQCECVRAIREIKGVNIRGDAWTLKPNTPLYDIHVGDVVLMKYGKVSHAAYVTAVETKGDAMDDGSYYTRPIAISLWEANYSDCKITTRVLSISDEHIRGILRV